MRMGTLARGRAACGEVARRGAVQRCRVAAPEAPQAAAVAERLQRERQEAAKSLRDRGKRVGKLAKKICKVKAGESMPLLGELALATEELNRARFSMEDVLCRMQAEGVADTCASSSSSSSGEDCAPGKRKPGKPEVLVAEQALPDVLAASGGQISVCEGKACNRKGENQGIFDELESHFAAAGAAAPTLARCKCLGQCKYPTSIRSECPEGEVRVVSGVLLDAVKERTRGAVAA